MNDMSRCINNNPGDIRNLKDYPLIIFFLKNSSFFCTKENIDACIEGLALAYKYCKEESQNISFSTYATKCMHSVLCKKFNKDYKRKKTIPKDKLDHLSNDECDRYKSFYNEDYDSKLIVEECLKILNERQRYIVNAIYFEGRNKQDIGKELNISRQRVLQIEQDALKKMRNFLER